MFRIGNRKRAMFYSGTLIAATAALFFALPRAGAAEQIKIVINGSPFTPPDALPFISSDRVMVPFRPIGEALGCSMANFDQDQQKVTMSLGSRDIEFLIGGTTMGLSVTDVNGGVVRQTVSLDAPATLVNGNRAFVPIRALSEGFGAEVKWDADSRTVTVALALASASPTTAPAPNTTPTPPLGQTFATTEHFEVITGSRAQTMHDNGNREVLFYFDSSDPEAATKMQSAVQGAQSVTSAKIKVYGLDASTSSGMEKADWIFNYVTRGTKGPAVLFLYDKDKILGYTSFSSQTELNTMFENWFRNTYSTPTPMLTSAPGAAGTGTITPTPSGVPELSSKVRKMNKSEALDKYEYGDRFVLLYVNSKSSDLNKESMNKAILAVNEAVDNQGVSDVYYMDDADQSDYSWFGDMYYSYSGNVPNPCIFYTSNSSVSDVETSFSSSHTSLAEQIVMFIRQ